MNVQEAIFWASKKLESLETPRLEAEILLSQFLRRNRVFLKANPDFLLTFWQQFRFCYWVWLRKRRTPLAQIVGKKRWCDLDIFVSPHTLIPRDETEILMEHISREKRNFSPKRILDLGTGSGCIALFCGKRFPKTDILAVDISPQALKTAQKNSLFHKVPVRFLQSDLLKKISQDESFDIIIANLPYIPKTMSLSQEVKKDPSLALFSGEDGLEHIRRLHLELIEKKIKFRELWLEFLPTQKSEIQKIFSEYSVKFFGDLEGKTFFSQITFR